MKIKVWAAILTILAAVGIGAYAYVGSTEDVEVFSIIRGNIQESIEVRGKVDLLNKQRIFSELPALVRSINVSEGDYVNKDTLLAELYVDELSYAPEKSALAVDSARNTVRNLSENIIPERLKVYELAKDQYEKDKASSAAGILSLMELKASESRMNAAGMALTDARFQLKAAKLSAEQMELQQKDVAANLRKVEVFSGVKGIVLGKYVEKGSGMQAGMPMFEIGSPDRTIVIVDIPAEDAVKIKLGQKAIIFGEVTRGKDVQGEVYYIAPKAETAVTSLGVEQQRIEVRISYDNTGLGLKPGYGVDTKIITLEKETLYVPIDSVFDSYGKSSVFTASNGRLELRNIETGIENSSFIEIVKGLSEKEAVVSNLRNSLKSGMKVKIVK